LRRWPHEHNEVGDKEEPLRERVNGGGWMDEEHLNPNAILASLGFERPGSTERVSGGRDTALFRIELGGELYALRVFRPGQDGVARREAEVMRAARVEGVPVPRMWAEGTWRDRAALLLSWCPGRPMAEELAARPWRAWPLGVLFGRCQAAIHGRPSPEALPSAGRAWIDWAGPGEEALAARIRGTAPREDSLVHLDYHPLNVMTDGERITGVLDWTNARAGDPRADYARTLTILRLDSGAASPLVLAVLRVFEAGWRHGYRRIAGRPSDMAPYYAWAGAVMLRDRGPRPDRPGGMTARELGRVRAWTERWRKRAECGG
jgi:aminoglycoside phosphotransferase (APT) family kinase protein